jgi:hypothetical protein
MSFEISQLSFWSLNFDLWFLNSTISKTKNLRPKIKNPRLNKES